MSADLGGSGALEERNVTAALALLMSTKHGFAWGNHWSLSRRAEVSLLEGVTVKNSETLPCNRKGRQDRGADIDTLPGKELAKAGSC